MGEDHALANSTKRRRWRDGVTDSMLAHPPRPFIDCEKRLIVIWSPKVACTTMYVWFAGVSGFLEEVRQHHSFPHRHRQEVFASSARYRESLGADHTGFHILRVIRDPYLRTASLYHHALKTRLMERLLGSEGKSKAPAVSFRQFLDLLGAVDLNTCNTHFRPMVHRYERQHTPQTVINLSRQDCLAN